MAVSYNKLWKLLIDKGMNKSDLIKRAGITTNACAQLGKNKEVHLEVLSKICYALDCSLNDVVDLLPADAPRKEMTDS